MSNSPPTDDMPPPSPSPPLPSATVTSWIEQIQAGDAAAAQKLWEAYFLRMVAIARNKLHGARKAVADEEDVALSAFKSFCLGAQAGRFPQLSDRDNLWSLLMAITAHKSVDYLRRELRQKRGGQSPRDGSPIAIEELIGREPDPVFAAELAENFERLLHALDDATDAELKQIALRKMEGATTPEIATALGCTRRTVDRKLVVIRSLWERAAQ